MSEYEVFSESDDTEYSPYIASPLSTSPETIRYSTLIEPALISALEPLNIEFFFTLTVLHVPTLNDGDLVCPLIIIFTSSERCVQRIRTIVESIWAQNDFREYIVSISLGRVYCLDSRRFPVPPSNHSIPSPELE
jgi:hypothetical protein